MKNKYMSLLVLSAMFLGQFAYATDDRTTNADGSVTIEYPIDDSFNGVPWAIDANSSSSGICKFLGYPYYVMGTLVVKRGFQGVIKIDQDGSDQAGNPYNGSSIVMSIVCTQNQRTLAPSQQVLTAGPACLSQLDQIVAQSTAVGLGQSLQATASSTASTVDNLMGRYENNLSQNFEQSLNDLVSGLRDASRKGGAIATSSQDRLDSMKADFITNCVK